MKIILDFVSESGTPESETIDLGNNFTIHDTKNSKTDSKDLIFQSNGQGGYILKN